MNKLRFANTLFNQPQLCTLAYAETVAKVLDEHLELGLDTEGLSISSDAIEPREPDIRGDGTLVIPILGSMVHRAGDWEALLTLESTDE